MSNATAADPTPAPASFLVTKEYLQSTIEELESAAAN